MKAKRVKIQSEHYPNIIGIVRVAIDIDNARVVIKKLTGLTYNWGEFQNPREIIDFAKRALAYRIIDFDKDDLVDAVMVFLAAEFAELVGGETYFAVNDGVDIALNEPYSEKHDADGRISDYLVYKKHEGGEIVYETDKIVENLLTGGEGFVLYVSDVIPIDGKSIKKEVAAPPTKHELLAEQEQAILRENFERAAEIRDMLNRLKC